MPSAESAVAPRKGQLTIRVITTASELEEIREACDSLPGYRDSESHISSAILRSRAEVVRPHVIVIETNGTPCAMLVGRLEEARLDLTIGYLHFRPSARLLYFVHGGVRGERSGEVCDLLVREIRKCLSKGEADLAYLNFLHIGSSLYESAKNLSGFLSRDDLSVTQPHFITRLPQNVNEFYANLSPNTRTQARSKARKIEKAFSGSVVIRLFKNSTEISTLAEHAERIMRNSYQRGLGVGFSNSIETRELLRVKAEMERLRGYVLYFGDRPAAFWIGDLNRREFISDFVAYDNDFAKYSPGIYLILKIIEGFCSGEGDSVNVVDFTLGAAQYKESLSNESWKEAPVYLYAPTIKGMKLKLARSVSVGLDSLLKLAMTKTGVLQKIKRRWRERTIPKHAQPS